LLRLGEAALEGVFEGLQIAIELDNAGAVVGDLGGRLGLRRVGGGGVEVHGVWAGAYR